MRHVCPECDREIVDGAETERLKETEWFPCGARYTTSSNLHAVTASHRHTKCSRERWYIVHEDGISSDFPSRPSILPGERVIRVAEEYVAEQSVEIKQLWPS